MEIGNPTTAAPSAAENARFLHEIEALSQALYLRRPSSTGRNRPPPPTKKLPAASGVASSSSIWNWKPLRALSSHIRSRRFNCRFTLHVHSVHGLPPPFDGAELQVHWRRRDGGAATRPAQVLAGSAEFGEALSYSCAVYGSRSGPQQSAKYEAKLFLLYVSVANGGFAGDADFGRHRVDLTCLLPATLEELEDERITGKWTTSFRLSGKAKGAILNVSFSFVVVVAAKKGFQSATLPTTDRKVQPATAVARRGRSVEEVRILREVLPSARSEVAGSVASLREVPLVTSKSDVASLMRYEMELDGLPKGELTTSLDGDDREFSVVERGVEMCGKGLPSGEDDIGADDVLVGSVKLREIGKVEEFGMESYSGSPKSECSSIVIDSSRGNVKLHELEKFEELGIVDNGGSQMSDFNSYVIENSLASSKHEMEVVDDDAGEVDYSSAPNDTLSESVKLDEIDKCLSEVEDDLNVGPYMLETIGVEEIDELERMAEHEDANHDQVGSENERLLDEDAYNGQVVNVNERLLDEVLGKEELDCGQPSLSVIERNEVDSPPFGGNVNYGDAKSNYKKRRSKSYSFDDATDSIASEFLNMLGVEHSPFNLSSDSDPESPRERLWKQFEKESLAAGGGLFGLDIGYGPEQELLGDSSAQIDLCDEFQDEFSLFLQNTEAENRMADNVDKGKTRAKMLEDLETEALMREWGLNEKTFQRSTPDYSGGFGSPINLLPEDPIEPPPLAEGLGSFIQTKDGGFLRSMNPSLFKNTKNNSCLIMQVSSPVVVPAEMGAGVIEIMQHLASVGAEKLSIQANKLMPLEDITGKTMQQVAWEAVPSLEARERMDGSDQLNWGSTSANYAPDSSRRNKRNSRSSKNISCSYASDLESEYVSIEELAPLAMDKIETLSIEGLRVQSGMSDEVAPSNICAQSFGDISALEGARARNDGSIVLDGVAGLQLLDIKGGNEDVDGLMSLSLSLDDWMRLDAGMVDEDEQDDSRTSKILAAHHANCTTNDLVSGRWKSDKRGERGKKWGLLGNNFTVALMVQLRDPLRNYEPVGTSMLALIQVERVFVPPKPKIYNSVSETIRSEESDDEAAQSTEAKRDVEKEDPETELIAQFKITDVHVAGIRTEPTKKKLWGSSTQQQSGSRWLLASGMGKNNKHPLMKSKPVTRSSQVTAAPPLPSTTSTVQPAESLWSISSRLFGYGARWREPAAPNPPVRNPNVAFPSQNVKLR